MARLQDLLAKKAQLDREIADTQRKEKSAAVAHVKTLMEQYGITAADLGRRKPGRPAKIETAVAAAPAPSGPKRRSKMAGKKVPPKYRNKATGDTWSGRGLKPRWLADAIAAGKKLSDFAI
jgi:DNA-binding protein H-NS